MIGLDTNVLVRYLAQDDRVQSQIASKLIDTELSAADPGFVSLVVLVETCWVLKRMYQATDQELLDTTADLLAQPHFELQSRDAVQGAVQKLRKLPKPAELPDALTSAIAEIEGCRLTYTFDKGAAKSAGMTLLR